MLDIKNLTKKYGDKIAVDDITFSVENGEIFGFIGPNGAGKTTTIKSIVGINEFEKGEIIIDGTSVKDKPIEAKSKIAYVQDNPELYEFMSGMGYLNFICDIFKVSKKDRGEKIEKYAKEFGIFDVLSNPISSYSHGMKQKLALISALAHDPKLLILDEPFVGLDPSSSHKLKEIMRDFCAKGCSIFFSSHVLEVVEKLCDRIAIINAGKIEKIGKVSDVIKDKSLEEIFLGLVENEK